MKSLFQELKDIPELHFPQKTLQCEKQGKNRMEQNNQGLPQPGLKPHRQVGQHRESAILPGVTMEQSCSWDQSHRARELCDYGKLGVPSQASTGARAETSEPVPSACRVCRIVWKCTMENALTKSSHLNLLTLYKLRAVDPRC